MAAAIAESADSKVIRMKETDVFGEFVTKTLEVDGLASDVEVEALFDDYEVLSNTMLSQASVQEKYEVTGLDGVSTNTIMPNLSAAMVFAFTHANTTNPSRVGRRAFKIRAPKAAIFKLNGDPIDGIVPDAAEVGTSTLNRLNRILGFLKDNMVWRETETDAPTYGGWEYAGGQLITESRVIDGDSLT